MKLSNNHVWFGIYTSRLYKDGCSDEMLISEEWGLKLIIGVMWCDDGYISHILLMWLCKGSLLDYTPDIPHTRDPSHHPSLSSPGKTSLTSLPQSPHGTINFIIVIWCCERADRSWWWITTGYWGAVTSGQWRPWHWPHSELDLTTTTATPPLTVDTN